MKNTMWLIGVGLLIFSALIGFALHTSYNNKYNTLESEARARQEVSKVTFDNTWKIISSQAKVAERDRESFQSTDVSIMNARSQSEGDLLMKWSQEAQVPITPDLYKTLQQSIESQRNTFTTAQKQLIDIRREAETMKRNFPGSVFLSSRKDIQIQVVTSDVTDAAFASGQENQVDPFLSN